jgi:alkyl hydroperoxide reductase subunit AhpF
MTMIAEKDRSTVRELLARELVDDVEIVLFTRGHSRLFVPGRQECLTCEETRELLDELVGLSDRLHLTTHDVGADPTAATRFNVTAVPTVVLRRSAAAPDGSAESRSEAGGQVGDASAAQQPTPLDAPQVDAPSTAEATAAERGANVRFLGLPGGYEFSTLLADIVDVSKGCTELADATLEAIRAIEAPVHIQVFVTPT